MHVDPLNVLDMLDVNVINTFSSPPPLTCPSFLFPSLYPYVCVTNHSSYHHTCCCCLQHDGWRGGSSALTWASANGHTEVVKALLATAGILVNHANVSISHSPLPIQ